MVSWRELWQVTFPNIGLSENFVSLDYTARVAHVLDPQAPVAQQAKVFHDTLDKCRKMTPESFVRFCEEWRPRWDELNAKDPDKCEAFYEALNVREHELKQQAEEGLDKELSWLFDEKEGE